MGSCVYAIAHVAAFIGIPNSWSQSQAFALVSKSKNATTPSASRPPLLNNRRGNFYPLLILRGGGPVGVGSCVYAIAHVAVVIGIPNSWSQSQAFALVSKRINATPPSASRPPLLNNRRGDFYPLLILRRGDKDATPLPWLSDPPLLLLRRGAPQGRGGKRSSNNYRCSIRRTFSKPS